MRYIGAASRGIRLPVISRGADLVDVVSSELIKASECPRDPFPLRDRDIVGVTESLPARAQGNYATLEDIAEDVRRKVPEADAVLLFPILSRNRFGQILKGIIRDVRGKVHILLSYPADEVGNLVMDPREFFLRSGGLKDGLFGEKEYEQVFGRYLHPFTGRYRSSPGPWRCPSTSSARSPTGTAWDTTPSSGCWGRITRATKR